MRFALLICAFYLGFALPMELALFALARWKGGVLFGFTSWLGMGSVFRGHLAGFDQSSFSYR